MVAKPIRGICCASRIAPTARSSIAALRLALRHKEDLEHLGTIQHAITLKQGLSFGAVWTVYHVARRLGIEQALGTTRDGKLALWQVMARVIDQGSRLSAVRLAMAHAACDVLGLGTFNEDALYENLDWLAGAQALVEDRLFAQRTKSMPALHQKSLLHRIFRYKNRALWSRKSLQNEAKKVLLTDGSAC